MQEAGIAPEVELRAPVTADAEAVYAVLRDRDLADLGEIDVTLDDVLDEWRLIDLAADACVALVDGRVAGYAVVAAPGARLSVSPAHDGDLAVGDALLDFTESRERAQGRPLHRQWLAAADVAARRRVDARGYTVARSFYRMTIDVSAAPAGDVAPEHTVSLRPVDPDRDALALNRLDQAAFADRPDFVAETPEEFADYHLRATDFAPGLSRVAERDGAVAGFALVRRWVESQTGYVALLAVDPGRQGQGIGRQLMSAVFAAAAADGLQAVSLGVASDNPGGLRFYRRLGMRERFRFDVLERPALER